MRVRAASFPRVLLASAILSTVVAGCASLRQNIRGQELSYRGAWYCEAEGCDAKAMVKSTRGSRDGEVNINTVKLAPRAAMAFTAAAPFDHLEAIVRDCKGNKALVPESDIARAGKHGVGDSNAQESWIVWIDPGALKDLERGAGSCAIWKVEAVATWSDSATHTLTAGLQIE